MMTDSWRRATFGRTCFVALGKMLQSQQATPTDVIHGYLRAANVQPNGVITLDDVHEMWFRKSEITSITLSVGDLLIVEGGSVGRPAVVEAEAAGLGFQNSLLRVRPGPLITTKYAYYFMEHLVSTGYVDMVTNAATIAHFTTEKLAKCPICVPPLPEQQAIANYLDRETAEIDAFIADQESLIALLIERRAAAVERAIWPAPTISWDVCLAVDLPELPPSWRMVRNKNLFQERRDTSADGQEEMLSVSHLTGVTPRSQKNVTMFEAESTVGYPLVFPGDLVINTMWAWMGAAGVSEDFGIVSPAYGIYQPRSQRYVPKFYDYLIRTRRYVDAMTAMSRGIRSSRLRLYPEVFLAMPVPNPPVDEQEAVVRRIQDETREYDGAIADAQRAVELSRERRAALITAAVTGQLDVTKRSRPTSAPESRVGEGAMT